MCIQSRRKGDLGGGSLFRIIWGLPSLGARSAYAVLHDARRGPRSSSGRPVGRCVLSLFLCVVAFAVGGQAYDLMPLDARILPLGQTGTTYEGMELGVRGGTLRLDRTALPRTWNPHTAEGTGTTWFTHRTHRGLVGMDPVSGAVVPDLAKSWTISDDGLVIVFHLRRGLRWSDGEPINAEDVVFTYRDVVLSEMVSSVFRDAQRLPDGTFPRCEKIDELTVAFFLSRAFRPVLQALGFPLLPRHKLAPLMADLHSEGAADAFDGMWALDTDPREIVGSGPWRVAEYRPGDGVTLERNPFYHTYDTAGTQLPYYDTVECTFVQNYELALRRFRSGESDILTVRAEDLPLLRLEADVLGFTVRITDEPGPGATWFLVNQDIGLAQGAHAEKRSLYRSSAFRQALAHSIDKQRIVDEVFSGLAFFQWSPVPMPSPFYAGRDGYGGPITEEDAVRFPYDPQHAASLLDGLGVVDQSGDGYRQLPSGAALTMELMTSDEPGRLGSGLVLVEGWQAIGLNATIRVVDFRVLVEALSAGSGDLIYMSLSCSDEPHDSAHLYRSCGSLHAHRYSACGDPNAVDRRVDELLELGAGTFDLDEAFAYYREYQQLVAGRLGFIYTVAPAHQYAYYDQVANAFKSCLSASSAGNDGLLVELCFDRRL